MQYFDKERIFDLKGPNFTIITMSDLCNLHPNREAPDFTKPLIAL
jgi:hypothetical protein